MISARDDPISSRDIIPWDEIKKNPNIIYAYTPRGGHLDFLTGMRRTRWYRKAMVDFINSVEQWDKIENKLAN